MSIEIQPYFAEGERYPALIGVRAEGDEYETAYVSKSELVDALAENAKLRELARHMRTCMEHYEMDGTISCDRCPLDNDTGNCDFEYRMSELGVDE